MLKDGNKLPYRKTIYPRIVGKLKRRGDLPRDKHTNKHDHRYLLDQATRD